MDYAILAENVLKQELITKSNYSTITDIHTGKSSNDRLLILLKEVHKVIEDNGSLIYKFLEALRDAGYTDLEYELSSQINLGMHNLFI